MANPGAPAAAPAMSMPEWELVFTQGDFERVRRQIYRVAGISLNDNKQQMVYSRLGRRLRALGIRNFSDYMDMVESPEDNGEQANFTNALTTNLTAFFREPYHFPILSTHLRRVAGDHRPVIWCAASSTGEEPYTLAITAMETLGADASQVRILASDIDTDVLARAARGVYASDAIDHLDARIRERYFLKGTGSNSGFVQVKDEVRKMVTFRQINLLDDAWPLRGPMDVIFCRNVLIYFDRPTQKTVVSRFSGIMQANGLLFVGHAESLSHSSEYFALCGRTAYVLAPGLGYDDISESTTGNTPSEKSI
jgi:chemotaxis protein methyltransferase CheR